MHSSFDVEWWRYAAFVGSFVGAVGLVMYAVAVYPYLHIEEYRKC
jgi:hypothetical protein